MIFKSIEFGSDDFRKECELRDRVLRAPLGLSLFDEDLECEVAQQHFGLFDDAQNLVACAIAILLSPTQARIRQMAVRVADQKQGFGRQILRGIEDRLSASGHVQVYLHARMSARRFYEKLEYATTGEEFIEVGISHIRMEKFLLNPQSCVKTPDTKYGRNPS
jgi:predicted GNAT family N-acyltransferase